MESERKPTLLSIQNSQFTSIYAKYADMNEKTPKTPRKSRKSQPLPNLGPLNITLAPDTTTQSLDAKELDIRSEETNHDFIQKTWSTYSTLNDTHRNQLLKGLLSRSSTQQIEFICTCLNLKSLDNEKKSLVSYF
jgi:hypothetical protein